MAASVKQILGIVNAVAPFELAEEWDNVGLLAGDERQAVSKILCALDLTPAVIQEAKSLGAELILTHHPVYFKPARNLLETDYEGGMLRALVRNDISMIAIHTNYDNACPGINDALAERLDLKDILTVKGGMMRTGSIVRQPLKAYADAVGKALNTVIRVYGDPDAIVDRAAVLGGAGGSLWQDALESGANVYITGEIGYHKALEALSAGLSILECGHRETELPGIIALRHHLQSRLDAEKLPVQVLLSKQPSAEL